MPIMEGPNLNGLRGFVRPRRIGLAPPEIPAEAPIPTSGIPTPDMGPAPRPTGAMEQAFTAQTPQEQSYQNLQTRGPADPKAGVWERIKGALLSGALAAREAGNQNPEAQGAALLGGLVGGGVSRGFAGNMRHNLVDLPRAKGMAAESRETADAGLGRRMGFAKAYGYDPESGTPTAATDQYENERKFRDQQAQRAQETNVLDKMIQGHIPITEQVGGRYGLTGVTAPFPPKNPPSRQFQTIDVGGKPVLHYYDPDSGQMVPVPGRSGQPLNTYQKPVAPKSDIPAQHFAYTQNRDAQKDVEEKEKEAKGIAGKYNETRAKHAQASTEYGQMMTEIGNPTGKDTKGKPMAVWQGKAITEADAKAKQAEADRLESELSGIRQTGEGHPNLVFDGSGAVQLRREQAAGKASAQGAQGAADHTGYTVGQMVEHGGKKYVYNGINPATGKMRLKLAE